MHKPRTRRNVIGVYFRLLVAVANQQANFFLSVFCFFSLTVVFVESAAVAHVCTCTDAYMLAQSSMARTCSVTYLALGICDVYD